MSVIIVLLYLQINNLVIVKLGIKKCEKTQQVASEKTKSYPDVLKLRV